MANAPAAGQALSVLRLLARHSEPVPASAIARDLDLPRSSVYHLLTVLCDHGFVVHLLEEQRYGLGVAAFELGSAYTRQAPLQRMARQSLVRLVDETQHNAHLAVLHGRDVLYVIEERAPGRKKRGKEGGGRRKEKGKERGRERRAKGKRRQFPPPPPPLAPHPAHTGTRA